jgi:preprotein translocase subunit SecG
MEAVILVIHLFLALAIIGLVLLQRSEGGGLGIGRSGGMGGLASARGTANALTRVTGICAFAFFCTSLLLGVLAGTHSQERQGILQSLEPAKAVAPATLEDEAAPADGSIKIEQDGATIEFVPPSAPLAE